MQQIQTLLASLQQGSLQLGPTTGRLMIEPGGAPSGVLDGGRSPSGSLSRPPSVDLSPRALAEVPWHSPLLQETAHD